MLRTDWQMNDKRMDNGDYVLADQIGHLLRLANQRHLEIFVRLMPDLTPTQFALLVALRDLGDTSQNELGRHIGIDAATTNGVVERLLKKQYIHSSTDPNDKRRLRLSLTATGLHIVEQSIPLAQTITRDTLDGLTQRESSRLLQLLKKLQPPA
ncbi:MAG: MarR family winged helix-turn-helix transcriptional regulator [Granulosicoccus sp.]